MELVLALMERVVVRHDFVGGRLRVDPSLHVRVHRSFVPRRAQHAALPFMKSSFERVRVMAQSFTRLDEPPTEVLVHDASQIIRSFCYGSSLFIRLLQTLTSLDDSLDRLPKF